MGDVLYSVERGDRIGVDSEVIYPKGDYGYLTWVRGEILGSPAFGKEFFVIHCGKTCVFPF